LILNLAVPRPRLKQEFAEVLTDAIVISPGRAMQPAVLGEFHNTWTIRKIFLITGGPPIEIPPGFRSFWSRHDIIDSTF